MLEFNELKVFLVAAETENFSETGRLLQISQPAVSGHIHSLEQRLKTQLFDRTGRNIRLNEVGEVLVPMVRNLLKEAQQLEEFMALRKGAVLGQLTIGCSTAAGKYILPKIMARFMDDHPDVRIMCDVGPRGRALDRLSTGEIDLAVSSLRVPRRDVEYLHFADDLLILITPPDHPWAQQGCITLNDLLEYPLIMRETGSGTSITINRELAQFDMGSEMLKVHLILASTEAIVQAVIEGIGPAFVSRLSATTALEQRLVVRVPVESLRLVQRLFMARHTGFHATEVQRAFWDFTFRPENKDLRPLFT
ncbi:MAG: LysR family transcriptional regulator [Anaerolineae bacterium]|nr:LysR family transcriptional regulator [Anaerolineae bacterium]